MGRKVDILGTEYEILFQNEKENPKMENNVGICERYSKKIILDISNKDDKMASEKIESFYEQVLRHEKFHAIFHECGVTEYAEDERLVELLAVLYPKIEKIMNECKLSGTCSD